MFSKGLKRNSMKIQDSQLMDEYETKMNELFQTIGQIFYEENRNSEINNDKYQQLFDKVKELSAERNMQEQKYLAMRECVDV